MVQKIQMTTLKPFFVFFGGLSRPTFVEPRVLHVGMS